MQLGDLFQRLQAPSKSFLVLLFSIWVLVAFFSSALVNWFRNMLDTMKIATHRVEIGMIVRFEIYFPEVDHSRTRKPWNGALIWTTLSKLMKIYQLIKKYIYIIRLITSIRTTTDTFYQDHLTKWLELCTRQLEM